MTICLWHFCGSEIIMGLFCRVGVLGMVEVLMLCLGLADKKAASFLSPSSPHPGRRPRRRKGRAWPRGEMVFYFSNY